MLIYKMRMRMERNIASETAPAIPPCLTMGHAVSPIVAPSSPVMPKPEQDHTQVSSYFVSCRVA